VAQTAPEKATTPAEAIDVKRQCATAYRRNPTPHPAWKEDLMPESTIAGTFGAPRDRSPALTRAGLRTPYAFKRQLTQSLRTNRGAGAEAKVARAADLCKPRRRKGTVSACLPLIRLKLVDSSGSTRVVCDMQFGRCHKSTRGQPLWRP